MNIEKLFSGIAVIVDNEIDEVTNNLSLKEGMRHEETTNQKKKIWRYHYQKK